MKAVAGPHLPLATLSQPHKDLPCHLTVLSLFVSVSVSPEPAPKIQTSRDCFHREGAPTETCYAPSSSLAAIFLAWQRWCSTLALPAYCPNTLAFSHSCQSPATKLQMSRDWSHSEGGSTDSRCQFLLAWDCTDFFHLIAFQGLHQFFFYWSVMSGG